MDSLVSTEWLAAELGAPDLRIVDASYHAVDPSRDAEAEFAAEHIPGAVHLGLKTLADPQSPLPGMAPPADLFAARLAELGIGRDSRIVLYDDAQHRTAARAWWLMRLYGISSVALLDGGLAKWKAEGRPVERGAVKPSPLEPAAITKNEAVVRTLDQVQANLATRAEEVVDARGAARFTGDEADPRGLASGHIPGAKNLPYDRLFAPDGTWKRGEALRAAFAEAGVDLTRPLVTTCGSGVTAAVVLFGAHLLGKADIALYDGSWSEWGADPATLKETGAAGLA